ncbi:hypothetical protein DVR09_07460 [Erythrobacter aureus]|uniref:Cation/H+ exchanger transmembrane domain-containing protein n=1 Tax=Erythrobacter aureus TaxID=2182384 RepID=A0A345YE43_9SPHN|nr:hypothetical protein DVR09_07460 [Erythrobacter aureus]
MIYPSSVSGYHAITGGTRNSADRVSTRQAVFPKVGAMESQLHIPYLREVILFLVVAGFAVPLLQRRVSPVLGYLMIGGLIGPYGLGLLAEAFPLAAFLVIDDLDGVRALAEIGVVFLLFAIGLELSLDRLWSMRRLVFGLGSAQILLTGVVIGGVAYAWGNSGPAALVLGACLALSSTAIVMQLLIEKSRLTTPVGRSAFSVLLMQDLAVVPILFIVGVLGTVSEGQGVLGGLALALGEAAITVVVIYAVGRLVLRPLFRATAQSGSREAFMAMILLIVLGTAAITGAVGLSMALGRSLPVCSLRRPNTGIRSKSISSRSRADARAVLHVCRHGYRLAGSDGNAPVDRCVGHRPDRHKGGLECEPFPPLENPDPPCGGSRSPSGPGW